MNKPRSPFDEDNEDDQPLIIEESPKSAIPERKWSFIALAVILFVFTWVRELTQIPAPATLLVVAFILLCWLVVHVAVYSSAAGVVGEAFGATGPARQELSPIFRPHCGILRIALGVVVGMWLWYYLERAFRFSNPSPIAFTFAVVVIALVVRSLVMGHSTPRSTDFSEEADLPEASDAQD